MGIYPNNLLDVYIFVHINTKFVTSMSIWSVSNLGLSNMNSIDISNATGNTNITAKINMALLEINLSCRN